MNVKKKGNLYQPSIKDLILLPKVGDSRINPTGEKVAYLTGLLDLRQNSFEVYCHIYDVTTKSAYQLTKSGMASTIRWVDENTLAIRKNTKNGFQLFVFEGLIGEGVQITDHPGGIEIFEPFAKGFVYLAEKPSSNLEARRRKFGKFINMEEEESGSKLYYVDYERFQKNKQRMRDPKNGEIPTVIELSRLMPRPYKIESFCLLPDKNQVFLNCRSRDDLIFEHETSCFIITVDLDSVFDENQEEIGDLKAIPLPKGARIKDISPDGSKLLISHKERELKQHIQSDLWIVSLSDIEMNSGSNDLQLQCATGQFDHEPLQAYWSNSGIYVRYWDESTQRLARISDSGEKEDIDLQGLSIDIHFFVNSKGIISFRANSPDSCSDIFLGFPNEEKWKIRRITENYKKIMHWDCGIVESIRWMSKDGTEIEGVLHKPSNFDPKKKYPLIFQVHGGPATSSALCSIQQFGLTYPTVQLVNRDILVLEPNYRGSLGRGQEYLELNLDNMGVGDMWDLESAIDHLVGHGIVDEEKIGSMGWSQGGYISSFVAMHSTRFKAVSAGAALSSWYTYFSGSDNRNSYNLSENPFENPDLYEKTAPISGIKTAQTPIMFQHGEKDQRVPLTSAMELFRALKLKGVETYLFVYPGMGHGWLKPRENFAVMVQNYQWFVHHLLGEELDFYKDDEGNPLESCDN